MRLLVLVLGVLLAGCLDGVPTDDVALAPAQGEPFREPLVVEGDTQVERSGGRWEARQTVTYENGVADAVRAGVILGIGAGSIDVRPATAGSYRLELQLVATAGDQATARDALASMQVRHEDGLRERDLMVLLDVETPPFQAGGLPLVTPAVSRSAHIVALLPDHLAYGLTGEAGSGDVRVGPLAGPAAELETGSGDVRVEGAAWDHLAISTGSGDVTVDASAGNLVVATGSGRQQVTGTFDGIEAESGSGDQQYEAAATASGDYAFTAGSGAITVALERGTDQAFDVEAGSGGAIELRITDGEPVGPEREGYAHVRSTGFDDAAVQTTVRAEAGSGDIHVHD